MSRDFDGASNHMQTVTAAALDILGDITLAAWINPDTISGVDTIMRKRDAAGNGGYHLDLNNGLVRISVMNVGTQYVQPSALAVTAGSWAHVAGRKLGTGAGSLIPYINGVAANSGGNAVANQTASTGNLFIATTSDGSGRFDGRIAECAIWSAALDDAEIAALGKGFTPDMIRPQSLVYYVPLEGDDTQCQRELRNSLTAFLNGTALRADRPRLITPSPAVYLPA